MISIIADFSQYNQTDNNMYFAQVPMPMAENAYTFQVEQPLLQPNNLPTLAELSQHFCLWDVLENGRFDGTKSDAQTFWQMNSTQPISFGYNYPTLARTQDNSISEKEMCQGHKQQDFDVYSWNPDNTKYSGINCASSASKRDMVNYKVLEGHQYQIIDNPDKKNCANKRLYIWKYDNCDKVFTKTWNLVSHFRVHTNEKPYQCSECKKLFTQRSNLSRHMSIHCKGNSKDKTMHKCPECPRKYSSKYNLNVSLPLLSFESSSWRWLIATSKFPNLLEILNTSFGWNFMDL